MTIYNVSQEEKRGKFEIMPMLLWKLQLQSLALSSCTCKETNESIRRSQPDIEACIRGAQLTEDDIVFAAFEEDDRVYWIFFVESWCEPTRPSAKKGEDIVSHFETGDTQQRGSLAHWEKKKKKVC
ncbi:Hypothetical predicted protein [Olea europaea subsp. europaea]|uniref:Uncharacterized protein n=1 Tax=Olea europaea subsp. europaea TaxID=158383 RepID=A0A8S0SAC7_OLEEU|nr:Hypothetical predicted protein [Olea europaea subsp. europaea]